MLLYIHSKGIIKVETVKEKETSTFTLLKKYNKKNVDKHIKVC